MKWNGVMPEVITKFTTKDDLDLEIYRWFMSLLDISPQLVQNIKLAEVKPRIGTENVRLSRLSLPGKEHKVLSISDNGIKTIPKLLSL